MREFKREKKGKYASDSERFGRSGRFTPRAPSRSGETGSGFQRVSRTSEGGGFERKRSFGAKPGFERRGGRGEDRPALEMTKVTCSACKKETEIPFKPRSNKPVFCRDCFEKQEGNARPKFGASAPSVDLSEINRKLDKIMKALKIE